MLTLRFSINCMVALFTLVSARPNNALAFARPHRCLGKVHAVPALSPPMLALAPIRENKNDVRK